MFEDMLEQIEERLSYEESWEYSCEVEDLSQYQVEELPF